MSHFEVVITAKTSSIIGTKVVNPMGDDLGVIKEIVIDPKAGRILYVVVAFGGFFHVGEKLFAIPLSAFEYNLTNKEYVLDLSKEGLGAAPGFDPNHWPSMADDQWNHEAHAYYGRTPYWI